MKKLVQVFIFTLLAFIGSLGCNRNSNQLPPSPKILEKTCKINGVDVIRVGFSQPQKKVEGAVAISIKNLSGRDLTAVKILIEVCKSQQSYDSCGIQKVIALDTIRKDKARVIDIPFLGSSILNDKSIINVIVLAYNQSDYDWKGIYSSTFSEFIDKDNKILYYSLINGYISADGKAVFRLKSAKKTAYNSYGSFVNFNNYSGQLDSIGIEQNPIILQTDSVSMANALLSIKLKLSTPIGKAEYIKIKANKQD